tara:strand:- start:287 stop:472 length:186 start_codon:yes stop_codon:yes gene_type:complete
MVTGIELLNRLKTEKVADDNFIQDCGYVAVQKSGKKKTLYTKFYIELLNAKYNEDNIDGNL